MTQKETAVVVYTMVLSGVGLALFTALLALATKAGG